MTHAPLGEDGLVAGWGEDEVELALDAYFAMLRLELEGRPYAKVDFYRPLSQEVGRSEGSIEYKFSNISAVLAELGSTFIDGYKPLANVQGMLRQKVQDRFAGEAGLRHLMVRLAEDSISSGDVELGAPIPVPVDLVFPRSTPERAGRVLDFSALESRNAERGKAGELLVLGRERRHLASVGRHDLAAKVRHVSVEDGDGLGYDVLSFRSDGVERFIEVKTTVRSAFQPFYVSRNEVDFSAEEPERFVLARVFHFGQRPGFYEMAGSLRETAELRASSYTALPRASGGH